MRSSTDRSDELAELFERAFSARVRKDFTDEVAAAYFASPLGPHDYKTARVVRALGKADIAGKEIVISLGENGPWGIGRILVGQPGNFVPLSETFDSYEDALRRVFSLRRETFLALQNTR